MGLLGGDGRKDKDEASMDKAKGRMKEAAGSLTGDKDTKSKGRADQRRGNSQGKEGQPEGFAEVVYRFQATGLRVEVDRQSKGPGIDPRPFLLSAALVSGPFPAHTPRRLKPVA